MCVYCRKQFHTVFSRKNKEKENISHKIIVVSSSDVNHRISKSGVIELSSDVIERGSGDAIGARPWRIER